MVKYIFRAECEDRELDIALKFDTDDVAELKVRTELFLDMCSKLDFQDSEDDVISSFEMELEDRYSRLLVKDAVPDENYCDCGSCRSADDDENLIEEN